MIGAKVKKMNNTLRYRGFFLYLQIFAITYFSAFSQKIYDYDVVVYGGTSGGITAAIQVAKMGKKVALLEPTAHIGGMNVEGLGASDIDNHPEFMNSVAIGGLALEFYRRIAKAYHREATFEKARKNREKRPELWCFESSQAEKVILEWLNKNKIALFYKTRIIESNGVLKKGNKIISIITENNQVFRAKIFIDATIEGDLLYAAGVETIVGRESNDKYGETKNGIRGETTQAQFTVPVDPYKVPGDPTSGVIPTIQDEPLGTPGKGDHRIQAYCFRVCLTQDTSNQIKFYKPPDYDSSVYEIYIRYEKAGGKLYRPYVNIPNGKTDLGAWHDLSHNLYGMNHLYPSGSYALRDSILRYHANFTKGLFYFLANDPRISEDTRKAWSSWGYCKDEFTDNNGFPRNFYVRDARRMISDYVITEFQTRKGAPQVSDPVAVAFWPPDLHSVRRIIRYGRAYNEGAIFDGQDWQPFGISYRALIPKKEQCVNLLTPTCISCSHVAYGAIRLECTFMALGQACGLAAVIAIDKNIQVQDVDYQDLRKLLSKYGQIFSVTQLEK